jgi:uncharacterized protein HemX
VEQYGREDLMPSPALIIAIGWLLTAALGAGGTLWYRGQYESEKAARARDLVVALAAEASAKAADATRTKALEDAHAAEIAKLKEDANARDRSIDLAQDSSACTGSAPMRALFDGLRQRPAAPGPRAAGSPGGAR